MKVAVAHAAWAPGRKVGLGRFLEAIPDAHVLASKRPEHASVWATRLWDWVAEQDEPVICANDDIQPHPDLVRVVEAAVEGVGPRVMSLFTHTPYAKPAREAGHHWVRTYWLTGPLYLLFPEHARSLLEWVGKAPPTLIRNTNEDNWGIHWAWEHQEPIWSTIPGLATHDTDIPSTLGYDKHPNRNSHVPYTECTADLTDPAYWRVEAPPPWVPNPWMSEGAMAAIRRMVKAGAEVCELCALEPSILKGGPAARGLGIQCIEKCSKWLQDFRRASIMKGAQRG